MNCVHFFVFTNMGKGGLWVDLERIQNFLEAIPIMLAREVAGTKDIFLRHFQ